MMLKKCFEQLPKGLSTHILSLGIDAGSHEYGKESTIASKETMSMLVCVNPYSTGEH